MAYMKHPDYIAFQHDLEACKKAYHTRVEAWKQEHQQEWIAMQDAKKKMTHRKREIEAEMLRASRQRLKLSES